MLFDVADADVLRGSTGYRAQRRSRGTVGFNRAVQIGSRDDSDACVAELGTGMQQRSLSGVRGRLNRCALHRLGR